MARIHLLVKYTFFSLLVFVAGLAIQRLTRIKHYWVAEPYMADDLIYNNSAPFLSGNFTEVLKKKYLKCITEPSKPFCLLAAKMRLEIFRPDNAEILSVEEVEGKLQNVTKQLQSVKRRMKSLLETFTKFMKVGEIKVLVIEPSMLFCLLTTKNINSMLSEGFNPGRLKGSRNVVTVGVMEEDSEKLEQANLTNQMLSAGFKIIKFRKWVGDDTKKLFKTVHYFFILRDTAVHVVIFHQRNSYLWHANLDVNSLDFEGLLFVHEGIFEKFSLYPLNLDGSNISQMYVPSDIPYFMSEVESSKFVDCATNFSTNDSTEHPYLTKEQLDTRTKIILQELKTMFAPYTVFFWLWSRTFMGWFRECDVFRYTSSVDLALTSKSVQRFNLTELISNSEFLTLTDSNEADNKFILKFECHGLPVNLYFLHEDKNLLWYRLDGNTFKFPLLTLCSTQLLGQKVHVPCNDSDVLKYAQNWTTLDT